MDFFYYMLIIFAIVGVLLLIYSMINFHGETDEQNGEQSLLSLDKKLETQISSFDSTLTQADFAMSELDSMTKTVFKEFDEKYHELLFLYQLIDEKKSELSALPQQTSTSNSMPNSEKSFSNALDISIDDHLLTQKTSERKSIRPRPSKKETSSNLSAEKLQNHTIVSPRFFEIEALQNQGLSIPDIAKQLNMGKGEVALILELGRGAKRA